jgi:nucleoside-diphosphate-sugar epimerase
VHVFATGGAGFIGRVVVRDLLARGDMVTAAVRDPRRASGLVDLGAALVASDLGDVATLERDIAGHDAVVHLAGTYRVGITTAERPAMWEANVTTTQRVLDVAIAGGIPRIVYVSTGNVLGNTGGLVLDEAHDRDLVRQPFVSYYDETKFRAHELAIARAEAGAPVVIAMPGTVFGPGDHSAIGSQLRQAFDGTLRYRALDDVGTTLVHVDDEAAGILRVLDGGRLGESYILAGRPQRLRQALALAAYLGGRRLTPVRIPTPVLRTLAPIGPRFGGRSGLPENMGEVVSAAAGVTYWASSAKAERELGFHPRELEAGLRDWLLAPTRASGAAAG